MKKHICTALILLASTIFLLGCSTRRFRLNADNYSDQELTQFANTIQDKLARQADSIEVISVNKHLQAIIIYKGDQYDDYFGDIIVDSMNVCKEVIDQAGVWLFLNYDSGNMRFSFTGFDKGESKSDCIGMFSDKAWPIDSIDWIDGYGDIIYNFPYTTTIFGIWASDWNYK